jgi:hypothetical protein
MSRRSFSSSDRRRRNAVKLAMEQLETRWLMHHGMTPLAALNLSRQ